jgi:hypothetical protein
MSQGQPAGWARLDCLTVPDWNHVVELAQAELPEVEISTSYGTPALKVRKKLFARLREDGEHLVLFVDFMEREALVQSAPEVFIVTPHYEEWPMVLVRLELVDPEELRELVIESWRRRAPKRLLAAYDEVTES